MRSLGLQGDFVGVHLFYFFCFLLHHGFAFSKLSFSSSHFSSPCLCWVWSWVAGFGGIVHFVSCSPSSLENTEYDNNLRIFAVRIWFASRSEELVVGDVWSRTGSHVQSHDANDTVPAASVPPPCDTLVSSHPIPSRFLWIPMRSPLMKGVPASRPIPVPHLTTQVGPSHPIKVGP